MERKINNEYAGGPSFYMKKGLGFKSVGIFYAVLSVIFLIIFAGVLAQLQQQVLIYHLL